MRYFLDTEFNGFDGALISLALVPEFGDQEYYAVLPLPEDIHPWVARNVIPYLGSVPVCLYGGVMDRKDAAAAIAAYLRHDADPLIIADWPEDIAHFCSLLVTKAGEMAPIQDLKMQFISNPGFSTAANSRIPHNALHDARALRDFVLGWENQTQNRR